MWLKKKKRVNTKFGSQCSEGYAVLHVLCCSSNFSVDVSYLIKLTHLPGSEVVEVIAIGGLEFDARARQIKHSVATPRHRLLRCFGAVLLRR